jgi:hypothetical protein
MSSVGARPHHVGFSLGIILVTIRPKPNRRNRLPLQVEIRFSHGNTGPITMAGTSHDARHIQFSLPSFAGMYLMSLYRLGTIQ